MNEWAGRTFSKTKDLPDGPRVANITTHYSSSALSQRRDHYASKSPIGRTVILVLPDGSKSLVPAD